MTQGIGDAISAGESDRLPDVLVPGTVGTKAIRGRSPFALAFDRLRRDRGAMISLAVIILIILVAIGAPVPDAGRTVRIWSTARSEHHVLVRYR